MKFMDAERAIKTCGDVTLTTHRLIQEWNHGTKTVMLEQLCSCTVLRKTNPIWLYLSIIPFSLGVMYSIRSRQDDGWETGLFFTAIFVAGYFLTGSRILELASAGAAIEIRSEGRNVGEFRAFVALVDGAKNERYYSGRGIASVTTTLTP